MGLFVMVGALVEVGVIEHARRAGDRGRRRPLPAGRRPVLLWGSAVLSGDRRQHPLRRDDEPAGRGPGRRPAAATAQATALWWALALGADLGGNATAVGASANVVVIGIAARNGHPISFWQFTKYGLVVAARHRSRSAGRTCGCATTRSRLTRGPARAARHGGSAAAAARPQRERPSSLRGRAARGDGRRRSAAGRRRGARWSGRTRRGSTGYESLRTPWSGPSALHLDLDLETWAADGLLAIFFFVAGLELKREFVVGELRRPSEAAAARWSPRSAAWWCPRWSTSRVNRGRPGCPPRLGGPDRDRHRVRARRARGHRLAAADGAAGVPADAGGRRRPRRDPGHRRLLHRRPGPGRARRRRRPCSAATRCCSSAGARRGGSSSRSPSCSGRWCTRAASTPPSPVWRSACSPGSGRTPARSTSPAERLEHLRPAAVGRVSRCRSSRCSPPGVPVDRRPTAAAHATPARSAWSRRWSSARSSACSAGPG